MGKLLFIFSQAAQNIFFGLMLLILSYLNFSELVIEYSLFFLLYSLIYPLIAFRFEQKIFQIGCTDLDECFTSVMLVCSLTLCLLLASSFLVDLYQLPIKEMFLSFFLCWLFGINFVLKQFLLLKKRILGISSVNITASILIFILWLLSENKSLYFFLTISIIIMTFTNIFALFKTKKYYILNFRLKKILRFLQRNFLDSCKLTSIIFISVLSANFLVLIFANISNTELAADLLIHLRILLLPISIFAIPASQIFANELLRSSQKINIFQKYFIYFFAIVVLYNLILILIPESIYKIVGIEKIILNNFYIALVIGVALRSIVSPLTSGFNVLNKNLSFMLIQLAQLIAIILMYFFTSYFYDYYYISIGYALITFIYFAVSITLLNNFLNRSVKNELN